MLISHSVISDCCWMHIKVLYTISKELKQVSIINEFLSLDKGQILFELDLFRDNVVKKLHVGFSLNHWGKVGVFHFRLILSVSLSQLGQVHDEQLLREGFELISRQVMQNIRTVALVMRKRDSCETLSTSGELFMIVLTLEMGRLTSLLTRPVWVGVPVDMMKWRFCLNQVSVWRLN